MKNILSGFLLILIILIGLEGWAMSLGNHKKFRFEDYKKAEDAQEALLKLYPLGSKVDDVVKLLENAGAKCAIMDGKTNEIVKNIKTEKDYIYCGYAHRKYLIFTNEWKLKIVLEPNDSSLVSSLKVYNFLQFI